MSSEKKEKTSQKLEKKMRKSRPFSQSRLSLTPTGEEPVSIHCVGNTITEADPKFLEIFHYDLSLIGENVFTLIPSSLITKKAHDQRIEHYNKSKEVSPYLGKIRTVPIMDGIGEIQWKNIQIIRLEEDKKKKDKKPYPPSFVVMFSEVMIVNLFPNLQDMITKQVQSLPISTDFRSTDPHTTPVVQLIRSYLYQEISIFTNFFIQHPQAERLPTFFTFIIQKYPTGKLKYIQSLFSCFRQPDIAFANVLVLRILCPTFSLAVSNLGQISLISQIKNQIYGSLFVKPPVRVYLDPATDALVIQTQEYQVMTLLMCIRKWDDSCLLNSLPLKIFQRICSLADLIILPHEYPIEHYYPDYLDLKTPLTPEHFSRIHSDWKRVKDGQSKTFTDQTLIVEPLGFFGMEFYKNLFEINPKTKPLFSNVYRQSQMLTQMMDAAFQLLPFDLEGRKKELDPQLIPILIDLTQRHVKYNVKVSMYGDVGLALVQTLQSHIGWTFVAEPWVLLWTLICTVMIPVHVKEAELLGYRP